MPEPANIMPTGLMLKTLMLACRSRGFLVTPETDLLTSSAVGFTLSLIA